MHRTSAAKLISEQITLDANERIVIY
jgi:hypothetical protein